MTSDFVIKFRDEAHLRAYLDHFLVPLERALDWVRGQLGSRTGRTIPSPLIVGSKIRTRHLCVWGFCARHAILVAPGEGET